MPLDNEHVYTPTVFSYLCLCAKRSSFTITMKQPLYTCFACSVVKTLICTEFLYILFLFNISFLSYTHFFHPSIFRKCNINTHNRIWNISTHIASDADCMIFRHKRHFNVFYASFCKPYISGSNSYEQHKPIYHCILHGGTILSGPLAFTQYSLYTSFIYFYQNEATFGSQLVQ